MSVPSIIPPSASRGANNSVIGVAYSRLSRLPMHLKPTAFLSIRLTLSTQASWPSEHPSSSRICDAANQFSAASNRILVSLRRTFSLSGRSSPPKRAAISRAAAVRHPAVPVAPVPSLARPLVLAPGVPSRAPQTAPMPTST